MRSNKLVRLIVLALVLSSLGFSQQATASGYYRNGGGYSPPGIRGGNHFRQDIHGRYNGYRPYVRNRYFPAYAGPRYYDAYPDYRNRYYITPPAYYRGRRCD